MDDRPISPHLTIYKPQITSVLSIMHRITGVILFIALMLLSWVIILATQFGFCCCCHVVLKLSAIGICLAASYHFLAGTRYLFWGFGIGISIKHATISGYAIIFATLAITIMFYTLII
jgi:succinate dehydrogenase / fumarate reductase cytochrome b subunit